jgi:hypothetical protein
LALANARTGNLTPSRPKEPSCSANIITAFTDPSWKQIEGGRGHSKRMAATKANAATNASPTRALVIIPIV